MSGIAKATSMDPNGWVLRNRILSYRRQPLDFSSRNFLNSSNPFCNRLVEALRRHNAFYKTPRKVKPLFRRQFKCYVNQILRNHGISLHRT